MIDSPIDSRVTDGVPIEYVSDDARLAALCEIWMLEPAIALDTEFERTNTFYARIGLIQIGDGKACYLIDPHTIEDWSAFKRLLTTASCTVVMHSCSEDLNLLQTYLGTLPASLFDTQLAAAFLGIGFSISYQGLVAEMLGVEVAKDETRSDWIRRPLSEEQIYYAATDVRYLLQVYESLKQQLIERGMSDWFEADCAQQLATACLAEDEAQWQTYYAGVSNAWRLDKPGLVALKRLCAWREQTARRRNKPRSWIVKDNDLMSLCNAVSAAMMSNNLNEGDIANASNVDRRFLQRNAAEIYRVLKDPVASAEVDTSLLTRPLNAAMRKKLKLSKQAAQAKAEQLGMAPELLGRKKYLIDLLRDFGSSGQLRWSGEFAGWRRDLLESDLLSALNES